MPSESPWALSRFHSAGRLLTPFLVICTVAFPPLPSGHHAGVPLTQCTWATTALLSLPSDNLSRLPQHASSPLNFLNPSGHAVPLP